jgi:hypothetical protein
MDCMRTFHYRDRQIAVNFNSHLETFYVEFRFQFCIKIKHMRRNQNNIYLLYIFSKLIVLYLKVFKFHLLFAGLRFVQKLFFKLSCCHDKHESHDVSNASLRSMLA